MASSSSSVKSTSPNSSAAKKSFLRRFVPVLAATNIAFIVYLLIRTSKKQSPQEESDEKVEIISATALNANAAVAEKAKPVEFPAPVKILSPFLRRSRGSSSSGYWKRNERLSPQIHQIRRKLMKRRHFSKSLSDQSPSPACDFELRIVASETIGRTTPGSSPFLHHITPGSNSGRASSSNQVGYLKEEYNGGRSKQQEQTKEKNAITHSISNSTEPRDREHVYQWCSKSLL
ncbi:hypothetical protein HPP92_008928 [Vanilla planifolia]|uniref:Uncharacterized protein n=1 Tax=Vanilla planifolia TaxID=51239 RepID=A0A835V6W9_VANPL|nr:hypothetical protein HPP92_008928 [Vanilla planifolia]